MEENLTGVYFWNKTLKPFAPCCQHLNLRVALKASPRRPNSQRPFEREPRSWNSGRVGLADGLARCCSDSGRGGDGGFMTCYDRWAWGLEMWQSEGEVFPRPDELLVFLWLLLLGHSSLWQVFAFVSAVCAVITEYPFISYICRSGKVKWVLFIWTLKSGWGNFSMSLQLLIFPSPLCHA